MSTALLVGISEHDVRISLGKLEKLTKAFRIKDHGNRSERNIGSTKEE